MKRLLKLSVPILLILVTLLGIWFFRSGKVGAPTVSQISSNTPKPITKATITAKAFDKQQLSLVDPTSIWVVVNKSNPLQPKSYIPPDLISVGGGQYMRSQAAKALNAMFAAAATQNLILRPLSGYRSYQTQVAVYGNEVKSHGQAVADSESARPGYSEHQSGLAIDIGGGSCGIDACFGTTKQGQWVAENAYKYGFIIRYPEGKTSITGYRYEPWHVRYVGLALATEMRKQNVETLEEIFGLPAAPDY